jgi:hypothetical protein
MSVFGVDYIELPIMMPVAEHGLLGVEWHKRGGGTVTKFSLLSTAPDHPTSQRYV